MPGFIFYANKNALTFVIFTNNKNLFTHANENQFVSTQYFNKPKIKKL